MSRIAIMGVAKIDPSMAENAPICFLTGYTVTPLSLTFSLIFYVGMLEKHLH